MTPEELKKTVRNHVGRGQTNEAIQVFKVWAETQGREWLLNDLLGLESEWNTLQTNVRRGIVSSPDESLKTNQIVSRLLGYLGGVGEDTGGPNGGRGEIAPDDYPKGPQILTVAMDSTVHKSALQDIPKPVKLFFLAATPKGLGQLNTGKESRFKDLIEEFDKGDRFYVKDEHGLGKERFRNMLFVEDPHIIHFGGHGQSEGLSLEDAKIDAEVLVDLLRLQENTRLVVLNACNTLPMAKELAKYVPYVIGTQGPLGDDAAIAFARSFYVGIASGKDIEKSFQFGINGIKDAKAGFEGIPVLVKGELSSHHR